MTTLTPVPPVTDPQPGQPPYIIDQQISIDGAYERIAALVKRVDALEAASKSKTEPTAVAAAPAVVKKSFFDKVKSELATCRKALVGPVAVLATVAASGQIPSALDSVVGAVLAVASYLGIRQVRNS